MALLIAVIALTLFSLLGLLSALDAATELRIGDNFESRIRAVQAARAGLSHARELLRGLRFDDQLKGPDGAFDASPGYAASARTFLFRSPLPWLLARTLDLSDPAAGTAGRADDGILNTGSFGAFSGHILIPITGLESGLAASGSEVVARYFVKVTDNNGEPSEVAADPADDPFHDGDGLVIVRSQGVVSTIAEVVGIVPQRNSVALFESRFRFRRTFQLDAALVLQGLRAEPSGSDMFVGDQFLINGGPAHAALGIVDPDLLDGMSPAQDILSRIAGGQIGIVQGAGVVPSVSDLTPLISGHSEKQKLLDKFSLWNFVQQEVPQFADAVFEGNQVWSAGNAPDLGHYNPAVPAADPSQQPRVTFVNGDLTADGGVEGAGVLVVTGRMSVSGGFGFYGLILLVGACRLDVTGFSPGLTGGLYMAALTQSAGSPEWAIARLSVAGASLIVLDEGAIEMALRLIPPAQTGCREITPTLDP